MSNPFSQISNIRRIAIIAGAVFGIILVVGLSLSIGINLLSPPKKVQASGTPAASSNVQVSPLLFGSNLDLLGDKRQEYQSSNMRQALQQVHLRIMRVSIDTGESDDAIKQAAQYVKDSGASLLVDLWGVISPGVQGDAGHIVKSVNQVFGQSTVYYEFGDEEDMQGTPIEQYIAAWNERVPLLKQLAPQARFVGPVTARYNQEYLRTFLQRANPLPDIVSWHEYTCNATESSAACLNNISQWPTHFASARQIMTGLLHTSLPIMITEWNYAANAWASDGKNGDVNFMRDWTGRALSALMNSGAFASMQYSALDSATPLIDNKNALTAQGQVMQSSYQQLIAASGATPTGTPGGSGTPTPTTTMPVMPTATQAPTSVFMPMPTGIPPVQPVPTQVPPPPTQLPPPPTPTPTPPCGSHNWYLHPYGGTTGSTHLTVTPYCGGKILLTLTQAPAYPTQMRICTTSGTCGSWVSYAGVNHWLTMLTNVKAGTVFYIQARDVGGKGAYVIYGQVKY